MCARARAAQQQPALSAGKRMKATARARPLGRAAPPSRRPRFPSNAPPDPNNYPPNIKKPKKLVNVCFVLICWATADNLARMSGTLHLPASPGAGAAAWSSAAERTARAFVSNGIWRAPIAACAIGGVMATLFNVTSCLVLVRYEAKGKEGGGGFADRKKHDPLAAAEKKHRKKHEKKTHE